LLVPYLPSPGPEAIGWTLSHSDAPAGVDGPARGLGFSIYALRGILHERALPAPSVLMLCGRLLAVASRLYGDARKVEETAFALGYASAPSLARALRTHTGLTPGQVATTSFSRMLSVPVERPCEPKHPLHVDGPIIPPAGSRQSPLGA
jgi:AraC-like DNA-binding protein